jgi:hypothetical protein
MVKGAPFGRKDTLIFSKRRLTAIYPYKTISQFPGRAELFKLWVVAAIAGDVNLFLHVGIRIAIPHKAFFRVTVYTVQSRLLVMHVWHKFKIEPSSGEPPHVRFTPLIGSPIGFRFKPPQVRKADSSRSIMAFQAILIGYTRGQFGMKERLFYEILFRTFKLYNMTICAAAASLANLTFSGKTDLPKVASPAHLSIMIKSHTLTRITGHELFHRMYALLGIMGPACLKSL